MRFSEPTQEEQQARTIWFKAAGAATTAALTALGLWVAFEKASFVGFLRLPSPLGLWR